MNTLKYAFELLLGNYRSDIIAPGSILSMLMMITILALYVFFVYRVVSKRTFYNKSFHISIMILPFFIGAIIMCLQTTAVVTLGTIGALAIVRFRTAVKDPVDMIYILWSVFIGITCGCRLYETCILTSLTVTIVLLAVNFLSNIIRSPYCLVIHTGEYKEEELNAIIKANARSFRVKSRNFSSKGVNYVYEVNVKDINTFLTKLNDTAFVDNFSLIEYDSEDII